VIYAADVPAAFASSADVIERIDSTRRSIVHTAFLRPAVREGTGPAVRPRLALACICSLLVTYVILAIAAWATLPTLTQQRGYLKVPFLRDWNVMFLFFVTMPALVMYLVNDQCVFTTALGRTVREDIVALPPSDAATLSERWTTRFERVNVLAQIAGAVIGALVAWANYRVYASEEVGYWIVTGGRLSGAGVVFLWATFLFFALTTIYVIRSIAIATFLRDVLQRASIQIVPFHPDGCGGLRPVGAIGLNNQYLLSIYGLNVISLVLVSEPLTQPGGLRVLFVLAGVLYSIIGPVVFVAPLMPFRARMLMVKIELMNEVAQRLRFELARVRLKLRSDEITREDEELIERLRKIGSVVEDLPVWPFDARTVRKFMTAYIAPLVGTLGISIIRNVAKSVWPRLPI
jgi:hypothetical protein